MKYFFIVLMMSIFIVSYVWQNIEMMKMKMDYRKLVDLEREVSEGNDRIRYNLESLRNFNNMRIFADKHRLEYISPDNVVIINLDSGESREDDN